MKYTIHQLEIFLKVAEKLSITKASKALHLTQPAVSVQLKKFQRQFPYPLIEIIGKKLYVTDYGHQIVENSQQVVDSLKALNSRFQQCDGELTGVLRISVISTAKCIIPYFVCDFMKNNPKIKLVVNATNREGVVESLENNAVDLSLVSKLPNQLKLESTRLMENQLFLVGSKGMQLPEAVHSTSIFERLSLIYREAGSGTRTRMERFMNTNNLSITDKIVFTGNESVKQAIIAGLGCSIMPLISVLPELKTGELQIIPVKGLPIRSHWSFVWRQDKKHTMVTKVFLEYLEKEKHKIVHKKEFTLQKKVS